MRFFLAIAQDKYMQSYHISNISEVLLHSCFSSLQIAEMIM